MSGKRRKQQSLAAKKSFWETIIPEARSCPEGVQYFLDRKNISKNNYYYWFHRLRQEHPEWQDLPKHKERSNPAADSPGAMEQPETEVLEKAVRRQFNAKYKAKILEEIDAAPEGQIASILRREGLYSSHIANWKRERNEKALEPKKRGPVANPLTSENRALREENARLRKRLQQAQDIIDVQKKYQRYWG